MATRNIVPRTNNEGQIGTSAKKWNKVVATTFEGNLVGDVANTPSGNIAATTVQAALNELDTEKLSISNAFLGGYKNKIINGNFDIWQRGTGFTAVSGNITYTADRWFIYCLGANIGATKESYTTGRSCLNANGAAGNTALNISQRIEANVFPLIYGNYYTMSFSVFSSSSRNVTVVIKRATTKDNFNNTIDVFSTGFSLSPGWNENKTLTFQSSGNYDTGIQVEFLFGAVTGGNVSIAKVQLEEGSVATPFESRHISQELILCQRYYCTLNSATGTYPSAPAIIAISYTTGDTNKSQRINFPIPMRAAPSINMTTATSSRYICASSIGAVFTTDVAASALAVDQFGFNLQNAAVGGGAAWSFGWIDNFGILSANAEL